MLVGWLVGLAARQKAMIDWDPATCYGCVDVLASFSTNLPRVLLPVVETIILLLLSSSLFSSSLRASRQPAEVGTVRLVWASFFAAGILAVQVATVLFGYRLSACPNFNHREADAVTVFVNQVPFPQLMDCTYVRS